MTADENFQTNEALQRLSEQYGCPAGSNSVDWLENVLAVQQTEIQQLREVMKRRLMVLEALRHKQASVDLLEALEAALEWIDAIPKSIVEQLPIMPGIDRDYVNDIIAAVKNI